MPTLQEKKEYIEQKIKEANPELMKLEFGCEVNRLGKYYKEDGKKEFVVGKCSGLIALVRKVPNIGYFLPYQVEQNLSKNWEIIGKEIQLHHVLVALTYECDITPYEEEGEMFLEIHAHYSKTFWWEVSKSYNNQKPEVYEFLYQIMNK